MVPPVRVRLVGFLHYVDAWFLVQYGLVVMVHSAFSVFVKYFLLNTIICLLDLLHFNYCIDVLPLGQSVFVQLFLSQMTVIQLVVLLVMVGNA